MVYVQTQLESDDCDGQKVCRAFEQIIEHMHKHMMHTTYEPHMEV